MRECVAAAGTDLIEDPIKIKAHQAANVCVGSWRVDEEGPFQGRFFPVRGIDHSVVVVGGSSVTHDIAP